MNYRRLRRLIIGLLAIVSLAGQIPFTYVFAEEKDGQIMPLAANETVVGAFTITTEGSSGTDYTYADADGVLTIKSSVPITIKNTNPNVATTDHIEVESGVNANITLAGVNIDVSSQSDAAAFAIADNSTGNVTITLADGTDNTLQSGSNCAGLQKNGDTSSGTLTINGNTGALAATGGYGGAGIGGGKYGNGSNITISGGIVTATGGEFGAGIGGGANRDGSNIIISGGSVMATGGETGAGIGGGDYGNGSNITISGGSITAAGGDSGAGIGGGYYGNGSDITISGGSVTTIGGDKAAGIGGGAGTTSAENGNGSNITILNACVAAAGGIDAEAIGAGYLGTSSNINIKNSLVIENGIGTVTGDVTVNDDFTIADDATVTIEEGAVLTVGNNAAFHNEGTITIDEGGTFTNNGKLDNDGHITNDGTLTLKGTVINNGVIIDNTIVPKAVIDYVKENLTGLENHADYIISLGNSQSGEEVTSDSNGSMAVSSDWFGNEISITETREYNVLSATQKLTIPERPEPPANLTATEDGTITGVRAGHAYEVSDDGGLTWKDAVLNGTTLTGLSGGTYLVRIKAVSGVSFRSNASDPVTIETIQSGSHEGSHGASQASNGSQSQSTTPKTGDDSNLALLGMLFILSGAGLYWTITVWTRKKRMN